MICYLVRFKPLPSLRKLFKILGIQLHRMLLSAMMIYTKHGIDKENKTKNE
jgi:hypothetical protein